MDKTNKKLNKFLDLYKEIQVDRDVALKDQSDADKELAEIYHEIEATTFVNLYQSHKMLMKLQRLLKRRRNVKGKAAILLSITNSLDGHVKRTIPMLIATNKRHEGVKKELADNVKNKQVDVGQLKINLV